MTDTGRGDLEADAVAVEVHDDRPLSVREVAEPTTDDQRPVRVLLVHVGDEQRRGLGDRILTHVRSPSVATWRWRPIGTTSGVPDTGSSITWHGIPKTSVTSSGVTMRSGAPSATIDAGAHRDQVVGVAAGVVEVVQDEHDRAALLLVEVDEQVEDLDLVGEVEERGRLVEQHQRGALGERHGDPHPLALAAGQLVDRPAGEVERAGGGEGVVDGGPVGRRPLPEPALVRVAAAADEVGDGDALGGDR